MTTFFYGSLRRVVSDNTASPIISRLAHPGPMAIDAAGKCYVSSLGDFYRYPTLTVYNAQGMPTGVRFLLNGGALKVAVDAAGIIYVLTADGLYTYHPDGTPAATTIHGSVSGMTVVG